VKKQRQISDQDSPEPADRKVADPSAQIALLAGGIAHDLNTVITAIYGYSEMALESLENDSDAAASVRRIIMAADRAKALTGQLLDLSHSSMHEKKHVSVGEVIAETLDFIKPSVRDNVVVTRQLNTPEVYVEADPAQLFRVFLNIAVNALQSIDETGGSLAVTLDTVTAEAGSVTGTAAGRSASAGEERQTGAERSHARIRFADTGTGMDPETMARIFDPFFTEGKKEGGTGLGLTVVRDIISGMNGTLNVSSVRGKGTVIDVLIPEVRFGSLLEKP
jgi:signal transduction histidine kinase